MSDPRIAVRKLTFSDSSEITCGNDDIVVFVGPNNSGKSEALRNILAKAQSDSSSGVVIPTVEFDRQGSADDVHGWLNQICRQHEASPGIFLHQGFGNSIRADVARSYWGSPNLKELAKFFVYHVTTEARLQAANPAQSIALAHEPLTHPIHRLQADDSLEEKISNFFAQAFEDDLIVHRNAGSTVPLYVGKRPIPPQGKDRVSIEYIREVERLTELRRQGDGMRSFVGTLLNTLAVDHKVILLDEPEAFLHPPQARLLGRVLAENTPAGRQLFIATHSGDFLRGILDAGSARIRVVRIRRDGTVNYPNELDSAGVRSIWDDSLLRHSNILDGLFHERVIVCESDSDCRFYSAMIESRTKQARRAPDILFTHCGGKHRISKVIGALTKLGVPTSAIVDFDIFADKAVLEGIVNALGATFSSFEANWKLVNDAISAKKPELDVDDLKREIDKSLASVESGAVPDRVIKDLRRTIRRTSPWALAKGLGLPFVPNGAAFNSCESLLKDLQQIGLFVVPVGELECFCKPIDSHGPAWVSTVLETYDLESDSHLSEARDFVDQILVR